MPNYDKTEFDPPAPMAQVTLRNLETGAVWPNVPMLMDCGADVTMIPQSVLSRLGLVPLPDRQHELRDFNDNVSYSPVVRLELNFCRRIFRGDFLVIDRSWGVIGRNVLNMVPVLLDGPNLRWDEYRPTR
jgi:hypothetical protein